ncbi:MULTISPECIES: hypothetical protein [Paraburkholderia]|uniref:Abortive infection Abi-like protein n=1 Tax=Paraburkholderia acidicola TaxID=1912599 RepID=A0ABV1LY66_9BURK
MLQFDATWRFQSPGSMSQDIVDDIFTQILTKVAAQGDRKMFYEAFKRRFAQSAGRTANTSSSESWAESDLRDYMRHAAGNAATFVDGVHDCLLDAERIQPGVGIPNWNYVNSLLAPSGYAIDPPNLVIGNPVQTINVISNVESLDAQARETIQASLTESENLLSSGKHRLAVQEILWLLETVSTAFEGTEHADGTVTGKYFNRIVGDLKRYNKGRVLSEVASWMEKLHGYLSSPTGGGVRHGAVLGDTYGISEGEARLFCDLTRSYMSYLLHEYDRLARRDL